MRPVTTRSGSSPPSTTAQTPSSSTSRTAFRPTGRAALRAVLTLSLGARDLSADLGSGDAWDELLAARSTLIAACRSAGLAGPVDSVYYAVDDTAGLRAAAEAARRLGFSGKSTLWPEQVAVINEAFGEATTTPA
jgi:citrate lyase beta subunit